MDSDGQVGKHVNDGFRDYRNLCTLVLIDEKGNVLQPRPRLIHYESEPILDSNNDLKKQALEKANFIIHPNETLYFEFYMSLPISDQAHVRFKKTKNILLLLRYLAIL